jgi:hypothetical protein
MRILKITETLWAYEIENRVYPGPRATVLKAMMKQGFAARELEYGVTIMLSSDHNVAEFGVLAKSFIFSKMDPEVPFLLPVRGAA